MFRSFFVIAAAAAYLTNGSARADALQDQVVALAKATRTDMYDFRRTIIIESNVAKGRAVLQQFDPRRPLDDRWVLITVDGRTPTSKEVEDARNAGRDPFPPYYAVAKWFGAPAMRSETAPGYVTYKFESLLPGTLKFGSHDVSADTKAEALVNIKGNVPFIEELHLASTKGFRMMLVASMGSMTYTMRYRQLPDGNVVPLDAVSDINGSAMGKSGKVHTIATFSDFQAAK
ncbi:MAG: hypothetical protein JWL66_1825 [Sphingomonadales bacterium]|nr:hypothetical protein [Sphingomonadales bacterium]